MVLCVEVVDAKFGERFKAFLEAAGYQTHERSDGKRAFHRFSDPSDKSFPAMIELFSRKVSTLKLPEGAVVTRISVEEDVISLSAILLDENYYAALQSAKRDVDGVTIVDETILIPFKAKAFLDLSDRSEKGEKADSRDIKKHRNDVFRLAQLLPGNAAIKVAEPIREDLRRFLDFVETDDKLDPVAHPASCSKSSSPPRGARSFRRPARRSRRRRCRPAR